VYEVNNTQTPVYKGIPTAENPAANGEMSRKMKRTEFEHHDSSDDLAWTSACDTLERGVIELTPTDHKTHTSFSDVACNHTYNVLTGEFNVTGTDPNGSGYFTVKIKTNSVYSRLGIKREIPDVKSTIKTVKLLQSQILRPAVETAQTPDAPTEKLDDDDDDVRLDIDAIVVRELDNLLRYGQSRCVTVKHPKSKESATYRIFLNKRDDVFSFVFTDLDSEKVTGTSHFTLGEVSRACSALLRLSDDDVDFVQAVKTIGTRSITTQTLTISAGFKAGELQLGVAMPPDSFTEDTDCYANTGSIFILSLPRV